MLICKKVQVSAHDNAVLAHPACGDSVFIVQTKHHVNVRLDMDSCRILYGIAFTIKMSKKEDH